MPRLLIGWELGAGSGHIQRLIPITAAFLERGWTVKAAVRDLRLAKQLFAVLDAAQADGRLELLQAPIFHHLSPGPLHAVSLANIFAHIGFADIDYLRPIVRAWEKLLADLEPHTVISDIAPSLEIAARGRMPVIVVGNGWTIPPEGEAIPFQDCSLADLERSRKSERRILDTVAKITAPNRRPDSFTDLLRGDVNVVSTTPQFDPYRRFRRDPLYWPVEIGVPRADVVAPGRDRGFAYLPKNHPARRLVAAGIAASGIDFNAFIDDPSLPPVPNMQTSDSPLDLSAQLPRTMLAVHHGGLGTAIACLVHRVPQLVCCLDAEKLVIGQAILEQGCGAIFRPDWSPRTLVASFGIVKDMRPANPDFSSMKTTTPAATISIILGFAQ